MKLLDQVRGVLRAKHYAYRTEQCYVQWIIRYIRFFGVKHPNTMGTSEIEQFLTHLATHDKVAASTQNQALGALLFLYRDVLKLEVGNLNAVRARHPVLSSCPRTGRMERHHVPGEKGSYHPDCRPMLSNVIQSRPKTQGGH